MKELYVTKLPLRYFNDRDTVPGLVPPYDWLILCYSEKSLRRRGTREGQQGGGYYLKQPILEMQIHSTLIIKDKSLFIVKVLTIILK